MSDKILRALMRLFAVFATQDNEAEDKKSVVSSFLKQQLSSDLVSRYLDDFEKEYKSVIDDLAKVKLKQAHDQVKRRMRIVSRLSTRILRISTEINEELNQQEKIFILTRLIEFTTVESNLSEEDKVQEQEFLDVARSGLNIESTEFNLLVQLITTTYEKSLSISEILTISGKPLPKKYINKARHISLENLDGHSRVLNLESANLYLFLYSGSDEVSMSGQLIDKDRVYILNTGSSIRNPKSKTIYFSDIVNKFTSDHYDSKILFEVKNVEYKFKSGGIGLNNINFTEESGHLVSIMGASGAGKSTLLNVLNGSASPSKGDVTINGFDIHKDADKVAGLIGHVSQDDLLIEELSVYDNLYYNTKLCFDNYNEKEIDNLVTKTLKNLGLYTSRDLKVGSPLNKLISGGQRKRLNIALELVREPAVLFLDEPTSGLSSRDSENIMDLLKELAFKGKLVFVVIHQPSSDLFKMFDRLIILDTGGYLIYNGNPIDSITYFKEKKNHANSSDSECRNCGNVNSEQIFNIVEAGVLDERGVVTDNRQVSPTEWYGYFQNFLKTNGIKKSETPTSLPKISFKTPNWLNQILIFAKRDVLSKIANTQYMIISLLEAPILAFLLAYIIRYYNVDPSNEFGYTLYGNNNMPIYIFMSVIVAIFIGLTTSAEEIIRDRKILKREAFLNLSWSSYLVSKVTIQLCISAIQAFSFVMIGNSIMGIEGMYFEYWIVLFSAWASSNIIGLLISDTFKTVVTIYITIPFLVIPQIILSGVMVKYENLNPAISSPRSIPFYGEIITSRWAYEALAVHQFKNNEYEKLFYDIDKKISDYNYKRLYYFSELENRAKYIRNHLNDESFKEQVVDDITLLRNELLKEQVLTGSIVSLEGINNLKYETVTNELLVNTIDHIFKVKHVYVKLFNNAMASKDEIIRSYSDTPEKKAHLESLKRDHGNETLADFVTNKNETNRVIEYKNELIRKIEPIYQSSEHPFVKAHFYAPQKQIFGKLFDTLWVNIFVLWIISILTYVALYYRLIRRALDIFEERSSKYKK